MGAWAVERMLANKTAGTTGTKECLAMCQFPCKLPRSSTGFQVAGVLRDNPFWRAMQDASFEMSSFLKGSP